MTRTALVFGLGVTGRAVAEALIAHGDRAVLADDRPSDEVLSWAAERGLEVHRPSAQDLGGLVASVDVVLPAPGLPDHHALFGAASEADVPINSEFDLAAGWDDRPIVAVTGTDGKTTVVTLIEEMLNRSGVAAVAVGNTDVPLVEAINDRSWSRFVVEASSFRLLHSQRFAPQVAAWLNFGPDHLDAHASLDDYESAKASIWSRLEADGRAIANRDDEVVSRHAAALAPGTVETFGADLAGPHGIDAATGTLILDHEPIVAIDQLRRCLPHDLMNHLAAGASALAAGASREGVADAMLAFAGLPHRVEIVAEIDGVVWVNDSKATTPHAAVAAVRSWPSLVLIAGGRNKGLAFDDLVAEAGRMSHVVAIGDAADFVAESFSTATTVLTADSMEAAVEAAASVATAGQAVVLSPACASYDWYRSYRHRGDHFRELVQALAGSETR